MRALHENADDQFDAVLGARRGTGEADERPMPDIPEEQGALVEKPPAEEPQPAAPATIPVARCGYKHWHRPRPGPGYWEWRCLVCGDAVRDHAPWWARLRKRLRG